MIPTKLRRRLPTLAMIAGLQLALVLVYWSVEANRQGAMHTDFAFESARRAPAMPAVALERADGGVLRTQDLRDRPLLLHFWATWCLPCREELPDLLALARERDDLRVLAVALDDDWRAVHRFFDGAVPPEVVRDGQRTLARAYEVSALPDTYLVDKDGAAVLRFAGARAWTSRHAQDVLREQLGPR